MAYSADVKRWISEMAKYLRAQWGLDDAFSEKVALFYLYLAQYGLSPVITSGFRSAEKQKELAARYQAGDRSVVVKPAENSKHSTTGFLGQPAAEAIDISTNNRELAARIARALNIGAGFYFNTPDGVHFYSV